MDFSKHTFRCSSLGYIMTESKEKSNQEKYDILMDKYREKQLKLANCSEKAVKTSEKLIDDMDAISAKLDILKPILDVVNLSESCKTHLCDIYTRVKYNRTEDVKSKYLEKGLLMEEDAITQYAILTGNMYRKNKERKYNEWIEGEHDFIDCEVVVDTKVNWSIFQFNRVVAKPIKPLYSWQLDGYMWLENKTKGRLAYVLLNTPEHLIKREENKLMYELFGSQAFYDTASEQDRQNYADACLELRRNHIYDDIPIEEKVRIFDVERSEERIEKIKKRVEDCRVYLQQLNDHKLDLEVESETD